jgi:carbon storage regulator CsrA
MGRGLLIDSLVRQRRIRRFCMLVLTRKSQESVVVGGSPGFETILTVKVLSIKAGKVRLGFEVAADIPIHRLEVWERMRGDCDQDEPM